MYSPMIPTKTNWSDPIKNIPMTSGAMPTEKWFQKSSLYKKYANPERTDIAAPKKPLRVTMRSGTLERFVIPSIAIS